MREILEYHLQSSEAALWWLGQAGYILRSDRCTVAIDPYLSDSAAGSNREFARLFPVPIEPEQLDVQVLVVTHDHADHLDPETIARYQHKSTTAFVAPRHTANHLRKLGIPSECLHVVEAGDVWQCEGLQIQGVFALPTGADVLDTTGYLLTFESGRSVYHTSDTCFHPLVLDAAPRQPDVMLVPINGKWGNPNPEQAVAFAEVVQPRFVIPNHYDLMELNLENPETFRWLCQHQSLEARCVIAGRMKPFVWGQ